MTKPDFRFSFFKGGRLAALELDLNINRQYLNLQTKRAKQ